VLGALWTGMHGCVVPVGPEWTDPHGECPPTIRSASPPVGAIFDPDASALQFFEVVLADQNTRDNLYIRWIIDYPPYVDGVSRVVPFNPLPGGDTVERPAVRYAPSCKDDQIAPGFSNHRLLLAVSDRPFAYDSGDGLLRYPDTPSSGSFIVEAAWQFNLDCRP